MVTVWFGIITGGFMLGVLYYLLERGGFGMNLTAYPGFGNLEHGLLQTENLDVDVDVDG